MNLKHFPLAVIIASVSLFTACKSDKKADDTPLRTTESSQLNDTQEWVGQYKGTLPCEDCDGIATTLTLKEDGSFQHVAYYRGKNEPAVVSRGTISWDDSGSQLLLNLKDQNTQNFAFDSVELRLLDETGQTISTPEGQAVTLQKNRSDHTLENKTWVLKTLHGKSINLKDGQKEVVIRFNSENAMIQGYNGCNNISMGYELLNGQRLKIAPGISTLMACPDDSISDSFNEVLHRVDNYVISKRSLYLHKAKMAPLAVFELKE